VGFLRSREAPCSQETAPLRVTLDEDVWLDSGREYFVRGRVCIGNKLFHQEREGIFEPSHSALDKRSVIAAHSLVNYSDSQVPIRLLHVGNCRLHLYKGTTLGMIKPYKYTPSSSQLRQIKGSSKDNSDILTLFKENLNSMDREASEKLSALLKQFSDIFSKDKFDIGCAVEVEHEIDTGTSNPIVCLPRRVPLGVEDKVDELVTQLLEHNIIRPSQSPWNAPIVVVRKKDGDIRMCVDYRKLNSVTQRPIFPIPEAQHLFDTLDGAAHFSSLDLSQGYHQVKVAESDIPKTAFTTRRGQFEYLRMPFGLCSAPATFQRLMNSVLRHENWEKCLIYLDDVLVFGRTLEEHFERLTAVFHRIREAGLKLSPGKCHFCRKEVEYLGHIITGEGVRTSPGKVEKVKNWPTPSNEEELRSFLGLSGYYRRFIHNYASIVAPLEKLCIGTWNKKNKVRQKSQPWNWHKEQEESFAHLKWCLTNAPILAFPKREGRFILDTDASHDSIGAVLSQMQDGHEKVIAYASHKLSKAERAYCITRKELLAVYKYIHAFKHYLYGRTFTVRTDHQALTWMLNWKKPNTSQYCSWIAELECYDFDIEHRAGRNHGNADALSRLPGCEQCELKHEDPKRRRNVKIIGDLNIESKEKNIRKLSIISTRYNQEDDGDLKTILTLMKAGRVKETWPSELDSASESTKNLWRQRSRLCLRGGLLYFKPTESTYALVVPTGDRHQLIRTMHHSLGHVGITKTLSAIRNEYYWPSMEFDTRITLNTCRSCQQRKSGNAGISPSVNQTITVFPFEKVALDITGPLPVTNKGYRYILGIVDYFSKFPVFVALRNTESKTVAEALLKHWICLFGCPYSIHSDRGTSFESSIIHELCQWLGIKKTKTAPYYPQSDGLIERLFRTMKDMLFATTRTYKKEWDEVLPIVEMGIRATIQGTIKLSPFETIFGKPMRTPATWIYDYARVGMTPTNVNEDKRTCNEFVRNLQHKMRDIWATICQRNTKKRENAAERHQAIRKATPLGIGQHVMAKILPVERGVTLARYEGPYKITKQLGDWTYELTNVENGKKIERNYHHLKQCPKYLKESRHSVVLSSNTRSKVPRTRYQPERYGFSVRGGSVV